MATRQHPRKKQRVPPAAEAVPESGPAGVRPIWAGTISFGLVTVPVNLFPAVRPADSALRMLSPQGTPLQRRFVHPGDGKDAPWDELVRGYEVAENTYVALTDAELESIAPRKSRDIELERFVPVAELDPFLFERAYVLTPANESTKAYRLLADVMASEGKAGVATFVMRTKEYLVAILAHGGILWAETLRFADELRRPADVGIGKPGKVDAAEVAAFVRTIKAAQQKSLDRDRLVERRSTRLRALAEKKARSGKDVVEAETAPASPEAEDSPDLFDAIRQSLRLVQGGASRSPRPKRSPAKGPRAAAPRPASSRSAPASRRRTPARRPRASRAVSAPSRP